MVWIQDVLDASFSTPLVQCPPCHWNADDSYNQSTTLRREQDPARDFKNNSATNLWGLQKKNAETSERQCFGAFRGPFLSWILFLFRINRSSVVPTLKGESTIFKFSHRPTITGQSCNSFKQFVSAVWVHTIHLIRVITANDEVRVCLSAWVFMSECRL